jgi:hypothetical protein
MVELSYAFSDTDTDYKDSNCHLSYDQAPNSFTALIGF